MFDTLPETIPSNLDTMPPGHVLAVLLDHIDIDRCTGYDRIRVLKAQQRLLSYRQAQLYRTMTSIIDVIDPDDICQEHVEEAAAAEIAAALRLTRAASDSEMTFALELRRRLSRVWAAMVSGDIDVRRARTLTNGTLHLSVTAARTVIDSIIDDAAMLTTGQLRHRLQQLCIEADPEDAQRRYEVAVCHRMISTEPKPAGTADFFGLDMPPDRLAAGMNRINRIARGLRGPGEIRTMDQLRADVFLDLLQGGHSTSKADRGGVHLKTDPVSLAGLANHPGELAGYGPVIADIARQVAEHQRDAEWRWTLIDPETKMPIDGGITRRRPTVAQRRYTQAQNDTCIHPGCRMPAVECDIDHRIPWAESQTTATADLGPLCRHHHTIRHRHGWRYTPLGNGDFQFDSPLGHTYTTSGRSP